MKRLLNIDEAAALLGIKKPTLYRYVCIRRIPFVRYNRRIFFIEDQLKIFVDQHSVEPIITSKTSNSED